MANRENRIVYFDKWLKVFQTLDESQKRWLAAQKAMEIGRGGIQEVHSITGLSRTTIIKGMEELGGDLDLAALNRIRHPGGGRKRKRIELDSPLLKALCIFR